MDKLSRLWRLRKLVEQAGGHIDGRKKLHKLAYLCQEAGTDLGQSFVFHMYGVYSPSIADDVEEAAAWHVLAEERLADGSYLIREGDEPLALGQYDPAGDCHGFEVVRSLAAETPPVLEVMSTVVYLARARYDGRLLYDKLVDLKGHLRGAFPRALDLARHYFHINVPEPVAR